MPSTAPAPTQAPTRTTTPAETPSVQPATGPEWQMDPDVMCPGQRETITRTIAPFLP